MEIARDFLESSVSVDLLDADTFVWPADVDRVAIGYFTSSGRSKGAGGSSKAGPRSRSESLPAATKRLNPRTRTPSSNSCVASPGQTSVS